MIVTLLIFVAYCIYHYKRYGYCLRFTSSTHGINIGMVEFDILPVVEKLGVTQRLYESLIKKLSRSEPSVLLCDQRKENILILGKEIQKIQILRHYLTSYKEENRDDFPYEAARTYSHDLNCHVLRFTPNCFDISNHAVSETVPVPLELAGFCT